VLAPANIAEFHRVLHREGLLLKVVPMERHLAELRTALYERPRERPCGDEGVLGELASLFTIRDQRRLTYTTQLPPGLLPDLVRMTPLFWKAKRERVHALADQGLPEVAVDLSLILAVA